MNIVRILLYLYPAVNVFLAVSVLIPPGLQRIRKVMGKLLFMLDIFNEMVGETLSANICAWYLMLTVFLSCCSKLLSNCSINFFPKIRMVLWAILFVFKIGTWCLCYSLFLKKRVPDHVTLCRRGFSLLNGSSLAAVESFSSLFLSLMAVTGVWGLSASKGCWGGAVFQVPFLTLAAGFASGL